MDLTIKSIYNTDFILPKVKGRMTIFRAGLSDGNLRQMMKAMFPGKNADWHKEQLALSQLALKEAETLYSESVDTAFLAHFGRKPLMSDYKVSGIYSDELPEASKDAIRAALSVKNKWFDICHAHNAATTYNS